MAVHYPISRYQGLHLGASLGLFTATRLVELVETLEAMDNCHMRMHKVYPG
jgi:hypothetical protein